MEENSLSCTVSVLKSEFGVITGKQALNERFNEKCVSCVKAVLSEVPEEEFENLYSKELLPDFRRVLIKASAGFTAPAEPAANYKSCGGDGHGCSRAGVSIQYGYGIGNL